MDANILMNSQGLDTATPVRQAQSDEMNNALQSEQILQAHYSNMNEREKSRLTSTVAGAAQLKTFLDQGDVEGAHNFLLQRKSALQNRMASGQEVDTQETDAALEMLRTGNIEELSNSVNGLMAAGQVYGILSRNDMPANIQEWQIYNQMPEDQRREYLKMKRANQLVNQGGSQTIVDPTGQPVTSYEVTPKPEQMPGFITEQEIARRIGAGTISDVDKSKTGKSQVTDVLNQVYQDYQQLDQKGAIINTNKGAGSNIASRIGSSAIGQTLSNAVGTEEQSIRNSINNKIPVLISAIRQATGMSAKAMDSNAELQFYLRQATDPTKDIQSNIQALQTLESLYGTSSVNAPAMTSNLPKGQLIKVTNGSETYEIDSTDLPAAQAEGFNPVK